MTNEEKQKVLDLYKDGYTFYKIWEVTGISGTTVSSFLRRHHPQLTKRKAMSHKDTVEAHSRVFMDRLGVPHSTAIFLAETTLERFKNKQNSCRSTGREFTVKYKDLVFPLQCPILGIELDYLSTNSRADNYPTFDRINNDRDYVEGNVHVVSWRANRLKSNGTLDDFTKMVAFLNKIEEST